MCSKAINCYLQSIETPKTKLILPDKQLFVLGRNESTNIHDTTVSRKQLLLKANCDTRTVKCVASGINFSGCDGFALKRNMMYMVKENSRLEVLLGMYRYDLVFEPKIEPEDDDVPPSKKLKLAQKVDEVSHVGTWEIIGRSLMIYSTAQFFINTSADAPLKMAGFDMDGTLIKTRSGERFPVDYKDWQVWSSQVKTKLQDLSKNGYVIVIFSNQLKLGSEKATRVSYFKRKVEAITQEFNVPMIVFIATQRDIYRKPAPGMWRHLLRLFPKVLSNESIFVGDAAGREKNWAPRKKKDHSNADRLFAINIGVQFHTPEEYFLGHKLAPFQMPQFDPRTVSSFDQNIPLQLNTQEAIMMVGCQGSGKSFFYQQNIAPHNYVWINRDTLRSKKKCLTTLEESLKQSKSVVIDNTHPDRESRYDYLEVCKKYDVPVNCFLMDVPDKQIKHNNCFRIITNENHTGISDILINTYLKHFQKPTLGEGFKYIYKFKFNPKFKSKEDDNLYKMYLLES